MSKQDWLFLASWMLWGLLALLWLGYTLLTRLDQPTQTFEDQLRRVTAALATPDRTIKLQP